MGRIRRELENLEEWGAVKEGHGLGLRPLQIQTTYNLATGLTRASGGLASMPHCQLCLPDTVGNGGDNSSGDVEGSRRGGSSRTEKGHVAWGQELQS